MNGPAVLGKFAIASGQKESLGLPTNQQAQLFRKAS